ncbi:tetraspanin-7 [Folsomia candida]|uniref:tetraspanin-7 n=1 Tax=Folsomia candida TaxID=158441 RepID=UPI000B8FDEC7|nr:tetraspanin-7 [Folsomia candida]
MRSLQTVAALTCMKTLLMIFNIVFWLSGIALLVLGVWLHVELHKYLELSPDFSATAPYVLVGTGILILFLATLACCCTIKEQPILLYIYAAFLAIVFVMEVSACISGYAYRTKLRASFSKGLNSSIGLYMTDHARTSAINSLQFHLHCCGNDGYADWYSTHYGKVPGSCCKTNMGCDTKNLHMIYTTGCYALVTSFLTEKLGIMAASALGLAIFQLFGVLLTACLAKLLQKTKYEQMT